MREKETGGPAFPQANDRIVASLSIANSQGMSLRDYFAVHASDEDIKAQALLILDRQIEERGGPILRDGWHIKARYMRADQMLEARKS